MRVIFEYRARDGALFALPLEVDEHRPVGEIIEDALIIARDVSERCTFRTVVLSHQSGRGPRSIKEIIEPILERGLRLSSVEGPLRS